jgi:hypothetical protein
VKDGLLLLARATIYYMMTKLLTTRDPLTASKSSFGSREFSRSSKGL